MLCAVIRPFGICTRTPLQNPLACCCFEEATLCGSASHTQTAAAQFPKCDLQTFGDVETQSLRCVSNAQRLPSQRGQI